MVLKIPNQKMFLRLHLMNMKVIYHIYMLMKGINLVVQVVIILNNKICCNFNY